MSFTLNWPKFSQPFVENARMHLSEALNKGEKPHNIVDYISVQQLDMGTKPPELEIMEIGDLQEERFRGIFKFTYRGDGSLTLQTKVQVNPLTQASQLLPKSNRNISELRLSKNPIIGGFVESPVVAADWPLVVPMQLKISDIRMNGVIRLVVDRVKGITLVFKNDPLESVLISSTFDDVPAIRKVIQRQIEAQLRKTFQHDLPVMIHKMSQFFFSSTSSSLAGSYNSLSSTLDTPQFIQNENGYFAAAVSPKKDGISPEHNDDLSGSVFKIQEQIYLNNISAQKSTDNLVRNASSSPGKNLRGNPSSGDSLDQFGFPIDDGLANDMINQSSWNQHLPPQADGLSTSIMGATPSHVSGTKNETSASSFPITDTNGQPSLPGAVSLFSQASSDEERRQKIMSKWASIYDPDDEMSNLLFPDFLGDNLEGENIITGEHTASTDDIPQASDNARQRPIIYGDYGDPNFDDIRLASREYLQQQQQQQQEIQAEQDALLPGTPPLQRRLFDDYERFAGSPLDSPMNDTVMSSPNDLRSSLDGFGFGHVDHGDEHKYFDIGRAMFSPSILSDMHKNANADGQIKGTSNVNGVDGIPYMGVPVNDEVAASRLISQHNEAISNMGNIRSGFAMSAAANASRNNESELWAQIGVYSSENPLRQGGGMLDGGPDPAPIPIRVPFLRAAQVRPDPNTSIHAAHLEALLSGGQTLSVSSLPKWGSAVPAGFNTVIGTLGFSSIDSIGVTSRYPRATNVASLESAEHLIYFRARPPRNFARSQQQTERLLMTQSFPIITVRDPIPSSYLPPLRTASSSSADSSSSSLISSSVLAMAQTAFSSPVTQLPDNKL